MTKTIKLIIIFSLLWTTSITLFILNDVITIGPGFGPLLFYTLITSVPASIAVALIIDYLFSKI